MTYLISLFVIAIWLYLLSVLKRCNLYFGHFVVGSFGFFIISMVFIRPIAVQPLARVVAACAGLIGDLTNTFTAFFKYGILFIETSGASITLQIDFECSGIIELLTFLSILLFFTVYSWKERFLVGIVGCLLIILSNIIRIIVICEIIHFFGAEYYYIAHAIIGRIVFYALSVMIYFYAFTKPQIVRTKLGKFTYGNT